MGWSKNKTTWFTFFSIILISIIFTFVFLKKEKTASIEINGTTIKLELAITQQAQSLGLSGRKELPADHGLLFVYNDYHTRNFWMKEMNFPLDIIWIKDDTIVGMEKNVPPLLVGENKHYLSPQPVNYVLEVNAGFCDRYQVTPNQKIKINFK